MFVTRVVHFGHVPSVPQVNIVVSGNLVVCDYGSFWLFVFLFVEPTFFWELPLGGCFVLVLHSLVGLPNRPSVWLLVPC